MSYHLPSVSRTTESRPAWSGMAIVVEGMFLLLFLIGSLAIIMQVFAAATTRAQYGRHLAEAVAYATSTAERFAADPTSAEGTTNEGDLEVVCDVTSEQTAAGTLYHATITVFEDSAEYPVYVLKTARYEREVE